MTYRQFVSRPKELERRLEHKLEDVQLKWTICQNTVPELKERVQTSTNNTTEISYIRYIESKKRLDSLCSQLDKARQEVRDFLYGELKEDMADILEWKYIDGKSLKEIAEIRGLTYDSMKNKLSKADREAEICYSKLQRVAECTE